MSINQELQWRSNTIDTQIEWDLHEKYITWADHQWNGAKIEGRQDDLKFYTELMERMDDYQELRSKKENDAKMSEESERASRY